MVNPNVVRCTHQYAARIVGGAAAGCWAGFEVGLRVCPKAPILPHCVSAAAVAGATGGAHGGYASALDSASCQDVVVRGAIVPAGKAPSAPQANKPSFRFTF